MPILPLQDRLENPVHPAPRIFQIANQYHTLNQFRIMLRFLPSEKTGPFPLPALRLQPIAALASETLDQALREQLERELALLERDENIAPNQRRKRMLQFRRKSKRCGSSIRSSFCPSRLIPAWSRMGFLPARPTGSPNRSSGSWNRSSKFKSTGTGFGKRSDVQKVTSCRKPSFPLITP